MFAPCAVAFAAQPTGTEWKEPENLSFGREERRAAFSSFDTLESALKILPEFSERTISLDSETAWKFKWSPDPASRPVGFEKSLLLAGVWRERKGRMGNAHLHEPDVSLQARPAGRDG